MAMALTTLPSYKHWLPATCVPLEVEDPLTLSASPVWYSELWLPWEFTSQLPQCISIASYIAVLPIQFPTQLLDSHVTATNTTFDSFLFSPLSNPANPGSAQMFQHKCAVPWRPPVTANQILRECHSCEVAVPHLLSPEQEGGCGWLLRGWV